jgi:hypothetical protein
VYATLPVRFKSHGYFNVKAWIGLDATGIQGGASGGNETVMKMRSSVFRPNMKKSGSI